MAHGLQVNGSDSGGDFLVADSNLSLVNLQVVAHGTQDHEINLTSALSPGDLLFVKNPRNSTGGTSFPQHTFIWNDGFERQTYTSGIPQWFDCRLSNNDKKINFHGNMYHRFEGSALNANLRLYRGWEVYFDWFLVRSVQKVFSDNLENSGDYGLQILTEGGQIAYDSRGAINDKTFSINGSIPPTGNWAGRDSRTTFTFGEAGSYCNIEWTSISQFTGVEPRILGLGVSSTQAQVYAGFIDNEMENIQWIGVGAALFSAKLFTGQPSGTDTTGGSSGSDDSEGDGTSTTLSGSMQLVDSSAFMIEGNTNDTITYNASTSSTTDPFYMKVYRNSGTVGSGELQNTSTSWTGSTGTLTIGVDDDADSEVGYQGESFTIKLKQGLIADDASGNNFILDEKTFILYDDDGGTTLVGASSQKYTIDHDATSATVQFSISTLGLGNSTINARIRYASGSVSIKTFTMTNSTTKSVVMTGNLPFEGFSSDYVMQVWNGVTWADNGSPFTIEREEAPSTGGGSNPTSNPITTPANQNILSSATSATVTFSNLTSGEKLRVVRADSPTNVAMPEFTITASQMNRSFLAFLPNQGSTRTYTPQVKLQGATTWTSKPGGNFTVTRNEPAPGGGNNGFPPAGDGAGNPDN
jgi:hypothetical protein